MTEPSAPTTILIIDDSPDFWNLLREALILEGYRVLEAADGREGVRLYQKHHPDFVLLDMIMPEKDGIETQREILRVDLEARVYKLRGRPRTAQRDSRSPRGPAHVREAFQDGRPS